MQVIFHRTFTKQYQKLPKKIQAKFDERLVLWLKDPTDSRLRVHPLTGNYAGYFSMSVTGDMRALYRYHDEDIVLFALISSHSELY